MCIAVNMYTLGDILPTKTVVSEPDYKNSCLPSLFPEVGLGTRLLFALQYLVVIVIGYKVDIGPAGSRAVG